ncbi:ABC transporter substrate-binding protein [Mycolicibacterium boenickei]
MSDNRLVLTHGCSLSNLPLFVAAGEGLFADEGLQVETPFFDNISSTAELLATGVADLGTAAYTQPLIDAHRPDAPVLVAGSGLMGISVLAREPHWSATDLAGRTVGTFRSDPMEVLLYDVLAAAGLGFDDVELRYFDVLTDAIDAWQADELAAVTLAEPFASRLRVVGAHVLSDGTELWGDPYPDTVLVASGRLLRERPEAVRGAVRALLRADAMIQSDLPAMIGHATPFYPGFDHAELLAAAARQPSRVDIRNLTDAVFARWDSLRALGLVAADAALPTEAVNLALLNDELTELTAKEIMR